MAAKWAKLEPGVVRSYVERFMGSVKDRLRGFDYYFPSPKWLVDSAPKLVYGWVGFYNYVRAHLSFGAPPKPILGSTELERLKVLEGGALT